MSCYHMNVISVKKNSMIRKDGEIADHTEQFIGRHSPEFKGYEFYIKENERLKRKVNLTNINLFHVEYV